MSRCTVQTKGKKPTLNSAPLPCLFNQLLRYAPRKTPFRSRAAAIHDFNRNQGRRVVGLFWKQGDCFGKCHNSLAFLKPICSQPLLGFLLSNTITAMFDHLKSIRKIHEICKCNAHRVKWEKLRLWLGMLWVLSVLWVREIVKPVNFVFPKNKRQVSACCNNQ